MFDTAIEIEITKIPEALGLILVSPTFNTLRNHPPPVLNAQLCLQSANVAAQQIEQSQSISSMQAPKEFEGRPASEIKELLQMYDWNWYLVADYLGCEVGPLRDAFACEQMKETKDIIPENPTPFESARIKPADILKLQNFVKTYLKGSLPVLFDEEMSESKRREIASDILLDLGFSYKLDHAQEFKDTYEMLENEAISLERWREHVQYLTIVEEALFRLSAQLDRERRAEEEAARRDSGSDQLEDDD